MYHSVRIHGAKGGTNSIFGQLSKFSQLNMFPVKASADITSLGGEVTFDMYGYRYLGQGDFSVRVTRFDPVGHIIVVRTLAGHPLAGWR